MTFKSSREFKKAGSRAASYRMGIPNYLLVEMEDAAEFIDGGPSGEMPLIIPAISNFFSVEMPRTPKVWVDA